MKNIICIFISILIFCSCEHRSTSDSIVSMVKNPLKPEKLSEIIDNYSFVILKTDSNAFIGGNIGKIKKQENRFYISSDNKILQVFDKNGKFLFNVGHIGSGPEEYHMISDFDVSDQYIILVDVKKLLFYDKNGKYLHSILLDFIVENIHCLDNSRFCLYTSGQDKVIQIMDEKGHIMTKGMNRNQGTRLRKNISFIELEKNKIIVQYNQSNTFTLFDSDKGTFSDIKLLPDEYAIDRETSEKYIEEYGMNYITKLQGAINIIDGLSFNNSHLLFACGNPKEIKGYVVNLENYKEEYMITANCSNDITYTDPFFWGNCSVVRNEDSFITYIYPTTLLEGLEKNISYSNDENYKIIQKILSDIDVENANPILIEFKFK